MSWVEKIKNDLVIVTGDGKSFSPQWVMPKRKVEFNTVEFNFPNVAGSFLDRREVKGLRFNLVFYFQGDNHLDLADDFIASAKDKRFWTVTHPLYGKIKVQPLSLGIDEGSNNTSKFTVPVIETLTETNPKTLVIATDKIFSDTENINDLSGENFAGSADVKSVDVNSMQEIADSAFTNTRNDIDNDEDGQIFSNIYNAAKAAILNAITDPEAALKAMQDLLQAPSQFKQNIKSRIDIFKKNFDSLQLTVDTENKTVNLVSRFVFEFLQMAVLSGMAVAASTPFDDSDYQNRNQVSDVVDVLIVNNSLYLETLDSLQIGDGSNPDDFIPNPSSMLSLNDLMNFTTASLFNIGLNAKQERFLLLKEDTDFVNLSHRLYGPQPDDSHIAELMRNNPLGLNGILVIKKDTKITYYI